MSFFNLDSPVMRGLSRMADLIWLNILTLFLCIPVITAGAAFTALNYMTLKIVRDEDCYITKGYFKSFKDNFKQATLMWLIMLVIIGILAGDFRIIATNGESMPKALIIVIFAMTVIFAMIGICVFPILSRYDNNIRNTFKNAAIMAIISLPKTLLMLVIWCIPLALMYLMPKLFPIIFCFGISGPAILCSLLYNNTFKKFEPETEEEKEKEDPDQWHVYKEGEESLAESDKEALQKALDENVPVDAPEEAMSETDSTEE